MKYVVNAAQMKAIDDYSIQVIGIPSLVLMEKAAMAVVDTMFKDLNKSDKILAVCGAGNNGGDGIATARILHHLGFKVDILLLGNANKVSEQTNIQLNIARNIGVKIYNHLDINEYNIIVDAIFGIGLSKDIVGEYADIIEKINSSTNIVYSIDIPSGINADNGKIRNVAIRANHTITFGFYKLGILLHPGSEYAGFVTLCDIGFPKEAGEKVQPEHFIYEKEDLSRLPLRKKYSNKGTYGNVLVIAGSKDISGACYLSAKAAYRMGVGIVKVLTAKENKSIIQTLLPEVLVTTYSTDELDKKSFVDRILEDINQATSIVIGPGIGQSDDGQKLLTLILKYSKRPT